MVDWAPNEKKNNCLVDSAKNSLLDLGIRGVNRYDMVEKLLQHCLYFCRIKRCS